MKNCQDIRGELSAYLDGEVTPQHRATVEAHLATCAHCRQELSEIKMVATGVAALPRLQPAPRFLTEVRRKIARGEDPEQMTWQDYVFRPFWLKVPLEVAVFIVVIGLVMRSEHPSQMQEGEKLEFAKAENIETENHNVGDEAAKTPLANRAESPVPDQTTPAEAPPAGPITQEPKGELSQTHEASGGEEKSVGGAETSGSAIPEDRKQFVGQSVAVNADGQQAITAQRIPAVRDDDELSSPPPSALSPAVGVIRSIELAQSKPGETVTVHTRDFDNVQSRAQQLMAKCNGRVVVVPPATGDTERTLFVELPQEYVAAFKLELLKASGAPMTVGDGNAKQSGWTNGGPTSSSAGVGGVLTGKITTNNNFTGQSTLGLADNETAAPPTVLLEIRVVAPAN